MIDYAALRRDQFRVVSWAADNLRPVATDFVVAYEPSESDLVAVIYPAPEFMAMLLHGGLVRHMRWVGDVDGKSALEGDGELLPTMTEQEAIEFIAWKDVPLSVQQAHHAGNRARIVICHRSRLPERTFRDAWRLNNAA